MRRARIKRPKVYKCKGTNRLGQPCQKSAPDKDRYCHNHKPTITNIYINVNKPQKTDKQLAEELLQEMFPNLTNGVKTK